jgi:Collagen triple helix repeat (20 copies)
MTTQSEALMSRATSGSVLSNTALLRDLTEAAADAVGREIAVLRRSAQQEREIAAAEHRARLAELANLERQLVARLAELKDGEPGVEGQHGERGERGEKGEAGEQGERGWQGIQGDRGERGDPGKQGDRGDRGDMGPPGKLPIVKQWTDCVHYEGDVVTLEGRTYQAVRDTGKAPGGADDWICLAERGANGSDGRSLRVCTTWSKDVEYEALDVVAMNGGAFVARYANPGACPGKGWQMIASQGKCGKPGERGAKGDRGDRGMPGLTVVRMECDLDGLMTVTMSDGSEVTCDFYPVLNRIAQVS